MKPQKKRVPMATASASRRMPIVSPDASKSHGRYIFAAGALCLITLLGFSNSFASGFVMDNHGLLLVDPRIQKFSGENIGLIWRQTYWWPHGESGLYRPFTTLSYLLNYAVLGNGDQPAGYHWINFPLHFANVLLVFALALRLLARRADAFRMALCIAALWAVHPLLTESVTNIVGRADLLAALAVLSGFLMYLKSTETTGSRSILWLAGLAAATTVGVFSKESAIVLPGVIVLYEFVGREEGGRPRMDAFPKILRGCLATLLPIAAMLWQRATVLSASPPSQFPFPDNPIAGATFWIGRLTAIKVLARYLWLALWPMKLSSDYSYSEIPLAHGSLDDWIAWLAVAAALTAIVMLYSRNRLAFFFACFAFLNLLPASNLLFPIGTIMGERLMYLPLVGLLACIVIAIGAAIERLRIPPAVPVVVVCLIVAGFSIRTWIRNLDWTNDLMMSTASVQTSPHSFKSHEGLAYQLFQADPHANMDRAIAEADQSLAILGRLPDDQVVFRPWTLAALYHLAKGDALREGGAREQYEQTVKLALRSLAIEKALREAYDRRYGMKGPVPPLAAEAYRILASAYLRLGQAAQALPVAMEAQTIDPLNVEGYQEIADAYVAEHRGEDAAIALAAGTIATSDHQLRAALLKLYQSGVDTNGCAVVAGPRGPALNPSCAIVHRDLCAGTILAHRQDLRPQFACAN